MTVAKLEYSGRMPIDNSSFTILAVDHNAALRHSLVGFLRDAGYRVIEAKSGSRALELIKQAPDLVTLDVNLPDIHGFEVCKQIKSDPATAHIPILHVSSTSTEPDARVEGLASGVDGYLAEPIDRAEFVATVAALLRLKMAETTARQHAEIAEQARHELAQLNATLETRVSERTAELKMANESLRELSVRVLQMQDDERRRIARELHDSVGQSLTAIKLNNAVLASEEKKLAPLAAKALTENDGLVDDVLRSIRTISHLLHPPLLDEAGLLSALRWYVGEFSQRSGIKVELDCSSLPRFPDEIETAIFRIVQESLGNIHRHSGSSTAAIHLGVVDGKVALKIQDQGKGIFSERRIDSKARLRAGVGIRGMSERAVQLGGHLHIDSGKNGTTISVDLPSRPARSDDNGLAS